MHEQSPSRPSSTGSAQRAAAIVARYPQPRSALLPLLHLVQHVEGYVSRAGIAFCAEVLEITPAEVSAVATFYTMYKREPVGEHLVSVCTNTLCAALGGDDIYAAVRERLGGIGHEETSGDPGARGRSPSSTPSASRPATSPRCSPSTTSSSTGRPSSRAEAFVDALQRGEKPHPTRGAPLTDFKTVELLLAGFFDGPRSAAPGNAGPPRRSRRPARRGARLGRARDAGQAARPAGPPGEEVTR